MRQQEFQPPEPKKDQSGQTTSGLLPSRDGGRDAVLFSTAALTAAAGGGAPLADLFADWFAFGRGRLARSRCCCRGAGSAPAALPRDPAGGFLQDFLQHCVDDA